MRFCRVIGAAAAAAALCTISCVFSAIAMAAETETWDLKSLSGNFTTEEYTRVDNMLSVKAAQANITEDGVKADKNNDTRIAVTPDYNGELTVTFTGDVVAPTYEDRDGGETALISGTAFSVTAGQTYFIQGSGSDSKAATISNIAYTYEPLDDTVWNLKLLPGSYETGEYVNIDNDGVVSVKATMGKLGINGISITKTTSYGAIKITPKEKGTLQVYFTGYPTIAFNDEEKIDNNKICGNGESISVEAGIDCYVMGRGSSPSVVSRIVFTPASEEPEPSDGFTYTVSNAVAEQGDDETKATGFKATITNNSGEERTFDTLIWTVKSGEDTGTTVQKTTTCTVKDTGSVVFGLIVNGLYDADAKAEVTASTSPATSAD